MDSAAAAGYARRDVLAARDAAVFGWSRFMASLAGWLQAFAGQVPNAPSISSTEFADHYDRSAAWVTGQAAAGRTATAVTSLSAALMGDRLIRNMGPTVAIGAAGTVALLVLGFVPAAVTFMPAMVTIGAMGTAGALARGRMDRYHPVTREMKDTRQARFETASRVGAFVLPVAIGQGMVVVGFQATMRALAVVAAALTAGLWVLLRGEGRNAVPRAPPSVWTSVVGGIRQLVGTPHGLVRAVLSIHLLTVLTGLYATALGAQMVDQLVLITTRSRRRSARPRSR